MAYMKRRIKKGKIKINGITLRVVDSGKHVTEGDVWIQAWWRSNGPQLPKYFEIEKNKDGSIPLYKKDNADSTYFRIGEGRIETPAERIEKNDRLKELTQVDASDRPPLKYQMRFTRKQWEAIEWAIDCGISAATTQFIEDKETVALVPVLQSVLDEINNRA